MNKIASMLSLCILLIASGCASKTKEKHEEDIFTVTSPLKTDTSFTREYVAQIQSVRNIEIRAQEKGYQQSIQADEGHYVKAGQTLFRIMPKMYEAEYLKAQAAVQEASLELMNTKTLAEKDIVSKTEQSIKEARLNEAKADLALAELHLSLTDIKAPFDGVIDRTPLKLGSLVDEGALLTTLSDNKSVYAYFNVSESEYLDFKTHAKDNGVNVSLLLANGQQHKYKGVVETIEGQFDNETGNIAFRAKFPNPDLLLKHGETGKVEMTIPLSNALVIPQKATYEIQDKIYVYFLDKNNVVRSRNITVRSSLPDLYVIDSGLSEKDKILLEGVQSVREDQEIGYKYIAPAEVISGLQLIRQ